MRTPQPGQDEAERPPTVPTEEWRLYGLSDATPGEVAVTDPPPAPVAPAPASSRPAARALRFVVPVAVGTIAAALIGGVWVAAVSTSQAPQPPAAAAPVLVDPEPDVTACDSVVSDEGLSAGPVSLRPVGGWGEATEYLGWARCKGPVLVAAERESWSDRVALVTLPGGTAVDAQATAESVARREAEDLSLQVKATKVVRSGWTTVDGRDAWRHDVELTLYENPAGIRTAQVEVIVVETPDGQLVAFVARTHDHDAGRAREVEDMRGSLRVEG